MNDPTQQVRARLAEMRETAVNGYFPNTAAMDYFFRSVEGSVDLIEALLAEREMNALPFFSEDGPKKQQIREQVETALARFGGLK